MTADTSHERTPLNGEVDFTMMYIAHDAFARDLHGMTTASEHGQAFTPETLAGWAIFTHQLHVHHTAEDTSLWPRLRAKAVQPDEVAVLDAMEMEHAQIDPRLEYVEDALAANDAAWLADEVNALTTVLITHMRHEEDAALPLAENLPQGQLVEIDDSYTLIPLDQPTRLAAEIRGFLATR
jgi:pimeloyl-ACP methyl ester carboxylesterase